MLTAADELARVVAQLVDVTRSLERAVARFEAVLGAGTSRPRLVLVSGKREEG